VAVIPPTAWPEVTFQSAPTAKVQRVYRWLGIKTSDRPLVEVQVVDRISPPGGISAAAGLHVFVPTYVWQDHKTREALVVIDRRATRRQIAQALVEALD